MGTAYEIAAYYFPGYHADPRNDTRHGRGWTEWQLVKAATQRFPGHRQPRVPLWGYEDEADPRVMEKKINAAADHCVNAFIFDWYWYEDGPFLNGALEKGYLKAPNADRCAFALMWANHDWVDIHPATRCRPFNTLSHGEVSLETFVRATDHAIREYFSRPSYWRVNGGLYFSFYDLGKLVTGLGGSGATNAALVDFRERAKKAGLGDLHLNAVLWNEILQPGEKAREMDQPYLRYLGFDSVTHYVWLHHQGLPSFPVTPYCEYAAAAAKDWVSFSRESSLLYLPNITVGWDSSPRTIQTDSYDPLGYPFLPVLTGNTSAELERILGQMKRHLDESGKKVFTINAWNEWTEGSYLEPDTTNGLGYLEAIRKVFQR